MKQIHSLSSIIDRYDALFLDLWGVIHHGTALYPGVHDALTHIRAAGKKIIFLSNAPRRASAVITRLTEMGIAPDLYDHVVSSGEAGYAWLAAGNAPFGNKYFFIGPQRDAAVLDGLDYVRVDSVKEADFLLNVGFGSDEQTSDDFADVLQEANELHIPMLCLNPDLEVVKISGERFPCAGVLAHDYEAIGGYVTWFGKPYPMVYDHAQSLLGHMTKNHILAVGDSLETDIPGAKQFGIDSLLITGGILKDNTIPEIEEMSLGLGLRPNYLAPKFNW